MCFFSIGKLRDMRCCELGGCALAFSLLEDAELVEGEDGEGRSVSESEGLERGGSERQGTQRMVREVS